MKPKILQEIDDLKIMSAEKAKQVDLNDANNNIISLDLLKANKSDITNQFVFKGATTYALLPLTAIKNDTWFVTDYGYNMSWNETSWFRSSADETNIYNSIIGSINITSLLTETFVYTTTGYQHFNNWFSTDLIPINATRISGTVMGFTTIYAIAFFDANGAFISGLLPSTSVSYTFSVNVPSNAKYYKISNQIVQVTSVTLTLHYSNNEFNLLISDFKDRLNSGIKVDSNISDLFTKTDIYSLDGTYKTYNSWYATDFTLVNGATKLSFITIAFTEIYNVAFFDSNKNFLSGYRAYGTGTLSKTYSVNIPKNAVYYRLANQKVLNPTVTLSLFYKADEKSNELYHKYLDSVIVDIEDMTSLFTTTDCYTSSGTLAKYNSWASTPYLPIDFQRIAGTVQGSTALYAIAFFDKNYTFISGFSNAVGTFDLVKPDNAVYYRVTNQFALQATAMLTKYRTPKDDIINRRNSIKYGQFDYLAFYYKNVLFIGDSLTEGDLGPIGGTTVNITTKNYPYYLDRMTDWDIVNAGHHGATAKTYWETFAQNINFTTPFDLIYINLGTNEFLTDTLVSDTSATPYTNYASTNTGSYCKIIEYIKAQNPNALIVLVTIPKNSRLVSDVLKTNMVIKQIAAKYSLPVADFYNESKMNYTNGSLYRPNDNLHYNPLGYLTMASEIKEISMNAISKQLTVG